MRNDIINFLERYVLSLPIFRFKPIKKAAALLQHLVKLVSFASFGILFYGLFLIVIRLSFANGFIAAGIGGAGIIVSWYLYMCLGIICDPSNKHRKQLQATEDQQQEPYK